MKKLYIICLLCICACIGAYYTYNYFAEEKITEEENNEYINYLASDIAERNINYIPDETVKINNLTVIKMQKYDEISNEFTEEVVSTPVIFLEMTKEDLLSYLAEYLAEPSREDVKEGIIAYELVKFTSKEVVLRKTYRKEPDNDIKYYGYIENGYVCIYLEDGRTIYDYTDISSDKLPAYIKDQLLDGMKFYGIDELYEFLETYSS